MRGHRPIETMRRKGVKPGEMIWVSDVNGVEVDRWHRIGMDPQVHIADDDDIERLDLRFAVGMRVEVSTFAEQRTAEIVEAFVKAGASRVLGSTFDRHTWGAECVSMTDTEGKMAWRK